MAYPGAVDRVEVEESKERHGDHDPSERGDGFLPGSYNFVVSGCGFLDLGKDIPSLLGSSLLFNVLIVKYGVRSPSVSHSLRRS
eukprot:1395058-Amorphochlora_amoeboformis.AAC.1